MSAKEINDLERIIGRFHDARPRNQACVACSCMIWEERTAGGESVWACASCHRPATLTSQQWYAEDKARRQAAEAHLAAAAAPKPRAHLHEALERLETARIDLVKLERALPVARTAVTDAQARHDRAVEAAETSNVDAAEVIAASFLTGAKPTRPAPSAAAAHAELAAAVDALVIARNAMVIIRGKTETAEAAVGYATDEARKAARTVIASEMLEDLLADVTEARATYIERTGQLAWLVQQHAIPDGDARARQLVADANTPPSAWREAATAGTGTAHMEEAMAALLADSAAAVLHSR